MKEEHPNISILKKFDPTNVANAADILTEEAVFHFFNPQLPDIQGDYIGLRGFQSFFNKMGRRSNESFKVNPISIHPFGEELVVAHTKNTMMLEGKEIEVDVVVVWRIVDGKITECWDIPAVNTVKVLGNTTET